MRLLDFNVGPDQPFFLIAGPCVIESEDLVLGAADSLAEISTRVGVPLIFKSSYDKANRTSVDSYRGPGLEQGLEILQEVRRQFDLPVTTDIHDPSQAEPGITGVDRVTAVFQDTGPGISAAELENVFNPFFTTKDKGTGLGLAITHKVITEHGGQIEVESALGHGSRFIVHLPV